ncbi:hypothetical protein LZ32DRAFT_121229 [Colletotrichum eremochloae]|nr:hypothetical protein LZ32DRAFT_121229 [Colletotrichum eremochloae]
MQRGRPGPCTKPASSSPPPPVSRTTGEFPPISQPTRWMALDLVKRFEGGTVGSNSRLRLATDVSFYSFPSPVRLSGVAETWASGARESPCISAATYVGLRKPPPFPLSLPPPPRGRRAHGLLTCQRGAQPFGDFVQRSDASMYLFPSVNGGTCGEHERSGMSPLGGHDETR